MLNRNTLVGSLFFTAAVQAVASGSSREGSELSLETITVIGKTQDVAMLAGRDLKTLAVASMVVNSFEVQRLKFIDPDELLDRIPGETQVRNLRIPNGRKSYTVPLVDGMSMGSPYTGATQDIIDINTFNIQRVEIIKGPASALYPNNAFGGTINVVTRTASKKSTAKDTETRVWADAGKYDRLRLGAHVGGSEGDLGYFVDINTQATAGYRDQFKNDRDQMSASINYSINDATAVSLRGSYVKREEAFPGDLRQKAFDEDPSQYVNGSDQVIKSYLTALKLERQVNDNGFLEVDYIHRNQEASGKPIRGEAGDKTDIDQDIKIMYRHDFNVLETRLTGGVQYFDGESEIRDFDTSDGDGFSDSGVEIGSVFAQVELKPANDLGLNIGVRHERVKLSSTNFINNDSSTADFDKAAPKLGVTYSLADNHLLWASYAEGFLTPSLQHLYDADSGNPDLSPEEATDVELGLRGSLLEGAFSYDIVYYDTDIDNYIVETIVGELPNGDDDVAYSNASKVNVNGLETVLEYNLNDYWRFGLTHTYAKNIYDHYIDDDGIDLSGNRINRSPEHHWNIRAAMLVMEGLVIELELDDYTAYFTNDYGHGEMGADPGGRFDRDERLNLRVSYDNGSLELWLHALNLTDTKEDRVAYSRGRRTYRLIDGFTVYTGIGYSF